MSSYNKVEKEIQRLGMSEVPTLHRATMKLAEANQMIVVPHARVYTLPNKSNSTKQQIVIVPQDYDGGHDGDKNDGTMVVKNGD